MNTSKYYALVTIVFLLLSQAITGQTDRYVSAEINTNGDILTGYVKQLDDVSMNEKVAFKSQLAAAETTTFGPHQVSSYTLLETGITYQSIRHTYQSNMGLDMEQLRFGRVLVVGEKFNLYRVELSGEAYKQTYEVAEMPAYVYYVSNNSTDELHKLEVIEKLFEGKQFKVINSYKGILKYLLRDWQYAAEAIDRTDFDDQSLIQLLENYHKSTARTVSVSKREEKAFKHNSIGVRLGYVPLAIPASVTDNSGYVLGGQYEFYNSLKKFPVLQLSVDYINLKYDLFESTSPINNRRFLSMQQFQVMLGPKHDFFRDKEDFSLYLRAAVGYCKRTYNYDYEAFKLEGQVDGTSSYSSLGYFSAGIREDNFIANFGTGVTYKNLSLDLGMERVTYSFLLQSYAPVVSLGYQLDW